MGSVLRAEIWGRVAIPGIDAAVADGDEFITIDPISAESASLVTSIQTIGAFVELIVRPHSSSHPVIRPIWLCCPRAILAARSFNAGSVVRSRMASAIATAWA